MGIRQVSKAKNGQAAVLVVVKATAVAGPSLAHAYAWQGLPCTAAVQKRIVQM